jgi:hypothetical protein
MDSDLNTMTLRDLMAMFAMQGMLANPNRATDIVFTPQQAYQMADALLKVREQQ